MIKDIDKAIEEIVEVVPEYQCLTSIPDVVKFTLQELSLKLDRLNVLKIILKSLNMRAWIGNRIIVGTLILKILTLLNEVNAISVIT